MQHGDGDKRIPARRRAGVRGLVSPGVSASVSEISGTLDVSPSTVRRDLGALEREGLLRGSRGRAVTVERAAFGLRLEERSRHDRREKVRIDGRAVSSGGRPDRDLRLLDRVSAALARRTLPITAVRNDIAIAPMLAEAPDIAVVIPGGEIGPGSFTLLAPPLGSFMKGCTSTSRSRGHARSPVTPSASRASRSSKRSGSGSGPRGG